MEDDDILADVLPGIGGGDGHGKSQPSPEALGRDDVQLDYGDAGEQGKGVIDTTTDGAALHAPGSVSQEAGGTNGKSADDTSHARESEAGSAPVRSSADGQATPEQRVKKSKFGPQQVMNIHAT